MTLIAAYALMWIGGMANHWLKPHRAAPEWAAPTFLLLAAAVVVSEAAEPGLLLVFAVGGFLAEIAGAHTGVPFGAYRYSGALGPAIAGVPIAMAAAWMVLLAFSRELARRVTARRWMAVLPGAAVMTATDLLIDPVATRLLGYWTWQQPGVWFGVPFTNFAGWFLVSALLLCLGSRSAQPSRAAIPIGASILVYFASACAAHALTSTFSACTVPLQPASCFPLTHTTSRWLPVRDISGVRGLQIPSPRDIVVNS